MVPRTIILFIFLISCHATAALALVKREMFQGVGILTSGNLGNFDSVSGNLYKRPGGPLVAPVTTGYSMDPHTAAIVNYGAFTLPAGNKYLISAWVFHKSVLAAPTSESALLWVSAFNGSTFRIGIRNNQIFSGQEFNNFTYLPIDPSNKWVWYAMALTNSGGANWNVNFYYRTIGGAVTQFNSLTNAAAYATFSEARFGLNGTGNSLNGRFGAVSLYTISDFSDVAYPGDVTEPTLPFIWHVNPATGDDSNDGLSAGAAWKTVDKINSESLHCGFFPATNYSTGDTLIIDTSGADLDVSNSTLTFQTRGLTVKGTGRNYWRAKLHQTIPNVSFVKTVGQAYIYQVPISNQPNIVVWEDDKWLDHPTGTNFSDVAAALDAVAGRFWTDGTNLWVHPFGDTSPITDGKNYTRSFLRVNLASAINLNAGDVYFADCYAGKTCLAKKDDNDDFGAYVIGSQGTFGGTSVVDHCYMYYGSKHALGLVQDAANSDTTITNCQAEQCTPWASQSPWVSYMGLTTSTNNIHRYIQCKTLADSGLVGSSNGVADGQSLWLSHNSGSGVQFKSIYFTDCYFPSGIIAVGISTNVIISGGRIGQVESYGITTVDRTFFDLGGVDILTTDPNTLTVRNCIFQPTQNLGTWHGLQLQSTCDFQYCTFDMTKITNLTTAGFLNRVGPVTLTFKNNAIVTASTNTISIYGNFVNTDTITSSKNIMRLGSNNYAANSYNDGSTTANRTFAQWQVLGFDSGSLNTDPGLNDGLRPYTSGSPVVGAGADLGPLMDYTGVIFPVRKDIGAYQYVNPPTLRFFGKHL